MWFCSRPRLIDVTPGGEDYWTAIRLDGRPEGRATLVDGAQDITARPRRARAQRAAPFTAGQGPRARLSGPQSRTIALASPRRLGRLGCSPSPEPGAGSPVPVDATTAAALGYSTPCGHCTTRIALLAGHQMVLRLRLAGVCPRDRVVKNLLSAAADLLLHPDRRVVGWRPGRQLPARPHEIRGSSPYASLAPS